MLPERVCACLRVCVRALGTIFMGIRIHVSTLCIFDMFSVFMDVSKDAFSLAPHERLEPQGMAATRATHQQSG